MRAVSGIEPFQQLCEEFGISRKTQHKWKEPFLQQGWTVYTIRLASQKRLRVSLARTSYAGSRRSNRRIRVGGRKLRDVMLHSPQGQEVPSESSFKRLLEKAGLVHKRRRRGQPC